VLHSDCATGGCDLLTMTCAASHCEDHVFDSTETGLDCGGGSPCPKCPVGQGCESNFDCLSNACEATSNVCVADQCADHHIDGAETDIDCGGSGCTARCPEGRKCLVTLDCAAGLVCTTTVPHVCVTP
jgi:hypothetical protein